ncbi:MAG: glycosyltransferase family 4 protein [Metallibacterium sp.]
MKSPRIVYWNNIPSPYMVERFNALAARGAFEFEAWFNDRLESGRSWEVDESTWQFKYRYLPATRVWGRVLHWPLPVLGRKPDVLVSLYAEPAFLVGWSLAKLRGSKTGFWVEVTFDRWVHRTRFKEFIKRWLFPRVDAIVTVGADGKQFAERYGAPSERIFFAPHTIDVAHYRGGSGAARPQREALRAELGLQGTVFIYVGRLWWGKGLHTLLEAFDVAQRAGSEEVSLLLVGDGPEETILRQRCAEHGLRNVVFAGFKQKLELPHYYALADVFVFPTLGDPYGLVVDEAMACSLPIISTSAAGEIRDRVEEGANGYIVSPEDSHALAARMLELAQNPELRLRMGQLSAEKILGHTPDKWAGDFEQIIDQILRKVAK